MSALKKVMNDEISKYQGRIYYLDIRYDRYRNLIKPHISEANWIYNTKCYDHFSFELHHVIKFTQYERNKAWFEQQGLKMCLILIPKIMHQHLENPEYKLSDEKFYKKYLIERYELLFSKKQFESGKYPQILSKATFDEIEYDGCFDAVTGECA